MVTFYAGYMLGIAVAVMVTLCNDSVRVPVSIRIELSAKEIGNHIT